MNYNIELFAYQIPILKRFVYHLIYHRELIYFYKRLNIRSEFWVHTMEAHLQDACIHWCMVFGSDKFNLTHWKNLFNSETKEAKEGFRRTLFEKTGFDKQTWHEYWNKMKNFRDKYVAHREVNFNESVLNFDKALEVTFVFDDWVRDFIYSINLRDNTITSFGEPPLRESGERLKESMKPFFQTLMEQTIEYHKSCVSLI